MNSRLSARTVLAAYTALSSALFGCAAQAFETPGDGTGVIFETDFSLDSGFAIQGINNMAFRGDPGPQPPAGWDAMMANHASQLYVVEGAGENEGNAMKFSWDSSVPQPTIRLMKHLTGRSDQGYNELFIRYRVKLPDGFQAGGPDQSLAYWKWGRLWQNINATRDESWTENKPDSGYVVWNIGGGPGYTRFASFWQDEGPRNDAGKGSAGGEHQMTNYFLSGADVTEQVGYFEAVGDGAWTFDPARPGYLLHPSQRYHTIEFHFRLASAPDAEDGLFEMYVDGDHWPIRSIKPLYGAPQREGLPTYNKGTGWNLFGLFDNLGGWNIGWGEPSVDGYVLIDDVVVSTERIGPDYDVRGTTPELGGARYNTDGGQVCRVRPVE